MLLLPSNIEYVKTWMLASPETPYWTVRKGNDTVLSFKKGGSKMEGAITNLEERLHLLSEGNYKITLYANPNATKGGITTELTIGSPMPNNQKTMAGMTNTGGWITEAQAQKMVELALEKKENELLRERVLKLETRCDKMEEIVKDLQKGIKQLTDDDEENDLSGEELIASAGEKLKAVSDFVETFKNVKDIKF